jgi:L-arabinose isomerase
MLEVCPSIAVAKPRVEIHPLGIGNREDPVRLVFDATPGDAFVVGLSDLGERFRLVANQVEVVPSDEPLPKLPVARAVWKPQPDFTTGVEGWLMAGGPHHTVLSAALDIDTLYDWAAMAGTELALIGPGTDRRRFADELRWNAAYHRLAERLV